MRHVSGALAHLFLVAALALAALAACVTPAHASLNSFISTESAAVPFAFDAGNDSVALYAFETTPSLALKKLYQSGPSVWRFSRSRFFAGDFDGDELTDVAAAYDYGSGKIGIFLFESSREFAPRRVHVSAAGVWQTGAMSFTAADTDADGKDDVVAFVGLNRRRIAAYDFASSRSYAPRRLALTAENFAAGYEISAFSGDIDGDGFCEALLAKYFYNGDIRIYSVKNAGGFAFRAVTSRLALGLARELTTVLAADSDGDRRDDILICAGRSLRNNGALHIYRLRASSAFTPVRIYASSAGTFQPSRLRATVGDVTQDGRADIVIQHNRGTVTFFYLCRADASSVLQPLGSSGYGFARSQHVSSHSGTSFAVRPRDAIRWYVEPRLSFSAGAIKKVVVYNTRKNDGIYAMFFDAAGRKLFSVPCSSGKQGSRSALGTFTVIRKASILRSFTGYVYARYPVYYRTHSALHSWPYYTGTTTLYHYELLGKPASSGCIRLPLEASYLCWLGTKAGYTRVTILP